jgi:hypothetical protein
VALTASATAFAAMMFLRCASLPVSRLLPSLSIIIGTPLRPAKTKSSPTFFFTTSLKFYIKLLCEGNANQTVYLYAAPHIYSLYRKNYIVAGITGLDAEYKSD